MGSVEKYFIDGRDDGARGTMQLSIHIIFK